jgi:hypothetical protein
MQVAHRWLTVLVVAVVAAQFLLAGAGAFSAISYKPHTALGWTIVVLSLAVLLLALTRRIELRASALLFAAVVVQVALGVLGAESSAWFGALHGLNALAVMGTAGNLARRAVLAGSPGRRA